MIFARKMIKISSLGILRFSAVVLGEKGLVQKRNFKTNLSLHFRKTVHDCTFYFGQRIS